MAQDWRICHEPPSVPRYERFLPKSAIGTQAEAARDRSRLLTASPVLHELASHPEQWMPWNYRMTLAGLAPIPPPGADAVDLSLAAPAADAVGAP